MCLCRRVCVAGGHSFIHLSNLCAFLQAYVVPPQGEKPEGTRSYAICVSERQGGELPSAQTHVGSVEYSIRGWLVSIQSCVFDYSSLEGVEAKQTTHTKTNTRNILKRKKAYIK